MKRRNFLSGLGVAFAAFFVPAAVHSIERRKLRWQIEASYPEATPERLAVRTVTINLAGSNQQVSSQWVRDELIPAINEAVGDGGRVDRIYRI